MTDTRALENLKKRLRELDREIIETEKRLPAHSIKPPVMHDLLELEDERDQLLKEISQVEGSM
jgi:capsular polysaccharide biosynthesis protein